VKARNVNKPKNNDRERREGKHAKARGCIHSNKGTNLPSW